MHALAATTSSSHSLFTPGSILALLGIAAVLGVAIVYMFSTMKKETIADLMSRVDGLKEDRADCNEQLARVQGRLELLESDFVERIATSVAEVVVEYVVPMIAPQTTPRLPPKRHPPRGTV